MKVILSQDVKDLGKAGQLVNVSEGHGRNFLIPRKLAVIADDGAMKAYDKKQKILSKKSEKLLAEAKETAEKIASIKVQIKAKSGSGSKLYGSVTNQEIADALTKQHSITVDKRKISMPEPIKSIGSYEIPIKLHQNVTATVHVDVAGSED